MGIGRPTIFTQELADEICARLAEGESLRTVCRSDDMPDRVTVQRWLRKDLEFRAQYTRAKEESVDALFEDMFDIADDGSNDWMETYDKEGGARGWKENGEAIQRSRLRVDVRKWALSKLMPKKYGEKIVQEHTGPDGGPVQLIERRIVRSSESPTN